MEPKIIAEIFLTVWRNEKKNYTWYLVEQTVKTIKAGAERVPV